MCVEGGRDTYSTDCDAGIHNDVQCLSGPVSDFSISFSPVGV